jgi:hypothetical protein
MIQLWPLLVIGIAPLATAAFLKRGGGECSARTALVSTLLCALCFCLTFLWQEIWLVIPKALTPDLHPTLYHNDHSWSGDNPIAELLQGSGAIATLASGLAFLIVLIRTERASPTWRLFFFWMAFQGLFQALTQLVIGTLLTGNDVGRALAHLGVGGGAKAVLFACAVLAMYCAGKALARIYPLASVAGAERSLGFAAVVFIPALLSVALIIPFRIPREAIEVVLIPLIVNGLGAAWLIAGAISTRAQGGTDPSALPKYIGPALTLCALLAFFQLLLRPGISF